MSAGFGRAPSESRGLFENGKGRIGKQPQVVDRRGTGAFLGRFGHRAYERLTLLPYCPISAEAKFPRSAHRILDSRYFRGGAQRKHDRAVPWHARSIADIDDQ